MIDHEKIEIVSESGNVRMPEFVQTPLVPLNPYAWMLFLKALCGSHKRWQGPAVVPGYPAQQDLVHTGCSIREETRTLSPLFAERHAASITSIAATPRVAGD
jgi:hypothetical protein